MAKAVKDQLIKSGAVTRGYLGIMAEDLTPDKVGELGLEGKKGALVVEVTPDSPAASAELKPDDLIIEFDGKSIDGFSSLRNAVALTEIGKKVTVKYIRGGEERQTEVTIVQEPQAETYSGDVLGLVVRELDDGLRSRYRYGRDVEGVVVVEVKPDSITRKYIGEGVVISRIANLTQRTDTKVRTLDEYKKAIEAIKSGDKINLELRSGPITGSRRLVVP
jgi:serine protease Do